jgi:hypothetical protein
MVGAKERKSAERLEKKVRGEGYSQLTVLDNVRRIIPTLLSPLPINAGTSTSQSTTCSP